MSELWPPPLVAATVSRNRNVIKASGRRKQPRREMSTRALTFVPAEAPRLFLQEETDEREVSRVFWGFLETDRRVFNLPLLVLVKSDQLMFFFPYISRDLMNLLFY